MRERARDGLESYIDRLGPFLGGYPHFSKYYDVIGFSLILNQYVRMQWGKGAWGTEVDAGWWEVKICAMEDERVSVILKGKMIQVSQLRLLSVFESHSSQ